MEREGLTFRTIRAVCVPRQGQGGGTRGAQGYLWHHGKEAQLAVFQPFPFLEKKVVSLSLETVHSLLDPGLKDLNPQPGGSQIDGCSPRPPLPQVSRGNTHIFKSSAQESNVLGKSWVSVYTLSYVPQLHLFNAGFFSRGWRSQRNHSQSIRGLECARGRCGVVFPQRLLKVSAIINVEFII